MFQIYHSERVQIEGYSIQSSINAGNVCSWSNQSTLWEHSTSNQHVPGQQADLIHAGFVWKLIWFSEMFGSWLIVLTQHSSNIKSNVVFQQTPMFPTALILICKADYCTLAQTVRKIHICWHSTFQASGMCPLTFKCSTALHFVHVEEETQG